MKLLHYSNRITPVDQFELRQHLERRHSSAHTESLPRFFLSMIHWRFCSRSIIHKLMPSFGSVFCILPRFCPVRLITERSRKFFVLFVQTITTKSIDRLKSAPDSIRNALCPNSVHPKFRMQTIPSKSFHRLESAGILRWIVQLRCVNLTEYSFSPTIIQ